MAKAKPVLCYHANCPDGFGSAWAFYKKYGSKMDYIPIAHYDPLPKLKNKVVFFADYAPSRNALLKAEKDAKQILVLDHHLSAYRELGDLECCHFDMNHSGAVLSWQHNFPDEEVPKLLRYIEDRDLWKFELPYAEELLAAVDSYPMAFEVWDQLSDMIDDPAVVADLLKEGKAILRYNNTLMSRLMKDVHILKIRGHEVPAINTPFFRSELVAKLAVDAPFAAGYHYNGKNFVFSLRSRGDSVDVSEIAGLFPGGGGHKESAGFSIKDLGELDE